MLPNTDTRVRTQIYSRCFCAYDDTFAICERWCNQYADYRDPDRNMGFTERHGCGYWCTAFGHGCGYWCTAFEHGECDAGASLPNAKKEREEGNANRALMEMIEIFH